MSTAEAAAAIALAKMQLVKANDEHTALAGETAQLPSTPVSAVAPLADAMGHHVEAATTATLAANAQLDVALAALAGTPIPPVPSPTPPPTTHPDLILERSNVTAPETLPVGALLEALTITGVIKAPPADSKWRKIVGGDGTKGKNGALCVGITNTGDLEAWVDDGQGPRIATVGLIAGKGSFFCMRIAEGADVATVEVDDKEQVVKLPNGRVPCDGAAYIGAGVYGHKKTDPINTPPGAVAPRLRIYRTVLTSAQIEADAKEWADLIDEDVVITPPDPGGGGGTPGGGGNLEPVDGSATQVLGVAAPGVRQTILGWGAGLGPINELGQVFPLIQKYAQTDFDNVRLNFMRLIWSGDGGTLGRAYKPVLEWIKQRMAGYGETLWVHATGYGYKLGDPVGSANRLAASIRAGVDAGCQIDSVCIQNEPGGTDPHWPDGDHVPAHRQMRAELDRLGLQRIKLVGLEYAKDDGWVDKGTPKNVRRHFDNLNGAGLIPGAVAFGAVHCYGDCTSAELYDKRWLTKGCSIFQLESGFGSTPSIGGRIVNDLNTGISRWSFHLLQARGPDSPGDYGQKLVDSNGNGNNYYRSFQACSTRFTPGTVMRLCTVNGGRAVFTQGNKSPMFLAAGRKPSGQWVLAAQNFIGGKQQVTFRVDEMAGRGGTLTGTRVNGNGSNATNASYQMQDGKTRFTLGGNELVVLVGP